MAEQTPREQPERELSDLERYVLDMGNRFSDAVLSDEQYMSLQGRLTALDYSIAQLGGHTEETEAVTALQQEKAGAEAQLQGRKTFLVDLWEESQGEEGTFVRLIRVRDLQAEIEADPTKTYLVDDIRQAKADLETWRHQTGRAYPSSD